MFVRRMVLFSAASFLIVSTVIRQLHTIATLDMLLSFPVGYRTLTTFSNYSYIIGYSVGSYAGTKDFLTTHAETVPDKRPPGHKAPSHKATDKRPSDKQPPGQKPPDKRILHSLLLNKENKSTEYGARNFSRE